MMKGSIVRQANNKQDDSSVHRDREALPRRRRRRRRRRLLHPNSCLGTVSVLPVRGVVAWPSAALLSNVEARKRYSGQLQLPLIPCR